MAKSRRGFRTIKVGFREGDVDVYTSAKKADALKEMMTEMPLYEGVKLMEVMEAVYQQGHKDGAREAFDAVDSKTSEARKAIPHRNPGRQPRPR